MNNKGYEIEVIYYGGEYPDNEDWSTEFVNKKSDAWLMATKRKDNENVRIVDHLNRFATMFFEFPNKYIYTHKK